MSIWTRTALALVVALAILGYAGRNQIAALFGPGSAAQTAAADGKARDHQAANVRVATAVAGALPIERRTIGRVVAPNSTALASSAAGLVASVAVADGAVVRAGDLIVKLDDRAISATLVKDQAQLSRDTAALKDATATNDRTSDLVAKGDATAQAGDDALAAIREAQAAIDFDNAQIAADRVALDLTRVTAPFDGQIGALLVSPGAYLAPGAPVVTLTQMKPLYAEFALPESDLAAARQALADKTLVARLGGASAGSPGDGTAPAASYPVVFLDNAVDGPSGTFRLRALLADDDGAFWPGQSLSVTVRLGQVADLVLVPGVAVQPRQDGATCFVVKADDTVEARKVVLALRAGDQAGIGSGLAPGEVVVTEGQGSLRDGAKVSVAAPVAGKADGPAGTAKTP